MTTTDDTEVTEELKQLRAEHERLYRKYGEMTDAQIDDLINMKVDVAIKKWLLKVELVEMNNKIEEKQAEIKQSYLETHSVARLVAVKEQMLITADQIDDLPDDFESLKKLVTRE